MTAQGGTIDFDVVTDLGSPNREAYLAWMARLSEQGASEEVTRKILDLIRHANVANPP